MRPEIIVFGIIAVVVVAGSFLISIPQIGQINSSLPNLGPAPELTGIKGWINSEPINITSLKGKVVLVDFWTYSCINCIRTLPYLRSWHEKYSPKLVIIGVHTPEFEFEKDYNNVKAAVEKYGLKYAIAQDNDYATWKAYGNRYWPRKYLIDKEGNIRFDHIGEGGYEETENAIQQLLDMKAGMTNISSDVKFDEIGTPELYLGYQFARVQLGNPEGFIPGGIVNYQAVNATKANAIYLSGPWKSEADRMISFGSSLFLMFKAKDVNIVAGGNSTIAVSIDGNPAAGQDVEEGIAKIEGHRLYNIVEGKDYNIHKLQIDAEPGFELYTFTFG